MTIPESVERHGSAAVAVRQPHTRRSSYGPNSPVVGSRGALTRQQIVDAALVCFTERGFHATAVEEIAAGADTSRATLYQYFESKEAIFVELMLEAGGALVRVNQRLGPLGPTADGFTNMHRWLEEWSTVFDRYSAMFVEWANISSPQAPLRRRLATFVDLHTEWFSEVLRDGGYEGTKPDAASILTLSLCSRFNYIRHVYRPGPSDARLLDSLATAIQLFLFPATPHHVLDSWAAVVPLDAPNGQEAAGSTLAPPIPDIGPLATLPDRSEIPVSAPFAGLSQQSARTVRTLLDAAGRVFAANGYDAANVDQIVTEAGLARGTYYRYFDDKLELMIALASECAAQMCPVLGEFAAAANTRDEGRELRRWLHRFLVLQRSYAGVLRAWTEGFPIDASLLAPAADVVSALGDAVAATFGPKRSYALDRRAAGMMLAGLLEHFPNEGAGSSYEPTDDDIIETQAAFVQRVLLARPEG